MSEDGLDEKEESDDEIDEQYSEAEIDEYNEEVAVDSNVEDDEDDATVEEALAAAIEARPVVGVRRSQRLQGNDIMRNYHLQLQMQDQIYNTFIQR